MSWGSIDDRVYLYFKTPQTIDRAVLQEDQSQGQRIRRYWLWALMEDHWQIVAQGTSVGNKKIDIFTRGVLHGVSGLLFDNQGSVGTPIITNLAAYLCDRY